MPRVCVSVHGGQRQLKLNCEAAPTKVHCWCSVLVASVQSKCRVAEVCSIGMASILDVISSTV